MPLFEFICDKCQKRIDKIMKFDESEKYDSSCECGNGKLKKIPISSFNVKYKGNWFSTTKKY